MEYILFLISMRALSLIFHANELVDKRHPHCNIINNIINQVLARMWIPISHICTLLYLRSRFTVFHSLGSFGCVFDRRAVLPTFDFHTHFYMEFCMDFEWKKKQKTKCWNLFSDGTFGWVKSDPNSLDHALILKASRISSNQYTNAFHDQCWNGKYIGQDPFFSWITS